MNLILTILMLAPQADALDRTISVEFDAVPLEDALQTVRAQLGTNLTIDPAVRDAHGAVPVSMRLKDVSVRTVLRIMLDERGLTLTRREGVLAVVTKESIADRVVTRVYDVRDLIHAAPQFPGPRMELTSPDDGLIGTILILPIDDPDPVFPGEFLVDLVPLSTGGDSWTENDRAKIELVNNMLVVTQSEATQREVADLLRLLRQYK